MSINIDKLRKKINCILPGKKGLENWYNTKYLDLLLGPVDNEIIKRIPAAFAMNFSLKSDQHYSDYYSGLYDVDDLIERCKRVKRYSTKRLL